MAKPPKDIAASVRQRLLNLARQEGQVFDVILVAFWPRAAGLPPVRL